MAVINNSIKFIYIMNDLLGWCEQYTLLLFVCYCFVLKEMNWIVITKVKVFFFISYTVIVREGQQYTYKAM